MIHLKNKVQEINIAYIGGGSRGWAWILMGDLAQDEQISGTVKLYDLNYDAAKTNEIIGNNLSERSDVKGKWEYKAVKSLKEALEDADFVIISILPGTFDQMQSDVHTPEKYGIYQSVGDTVGPGGIIRALRTIPIFIDFAKAVKEYCPNAWVINYTNPMTLCTAALYSVFPEIKAFGCCHEVFDTQDLLARMVNEFDDKENAARNDIKVNVLGVNHFTWLNEATYKGIDLIPMYEKFVDKYYEDGYHPFGDESDHWINSLFGSGSRVKFDLFRRYGVIAAAGDRHLAEAVPPWYISSPEKVKEYMFSLTPVSWRKEYKLKMIEKSQNLVSGKEKFELKHSGEEGVRQIKALLGLGDLITNVNIPNVGQMEDVPMGAVVETNATFRNDNIKPIMSGKLPDDVHNLVIRQVYNQLTVLKAVTTNDIELAFNAFVNDPLVTIGLDDARALFDEMIENTIA